MDKVLNSFLQKASIDFNRTVSEYVLSKDLKFWPNNNNNNHLR